MSNYGELNPIAEHRIPEAFRWYERTYDQIQHANHGIPKSTYRCRNT